MSWARKSGRVIHDGPVVYDMPAVMSPYAASPPPWRERKSPGHPLCPDCQKTRRGACGQHRDFHYITRASAGVG